MDDETKKMLSEILASVKDLGDRVANIEHGAQRPSSQQDAPVATGKKMSIKEFIIDRAPTNGVQTTLTIAYYLEKYEDTSPVNTADLEKGFRAAKEPVPTNLNDKTNMCVKNGHMMEAEAKKDSTKAWVVTRSGEQVVEAGFSKKGK